MFALICAGFGLLAGLAFFIYLCWFMHIRDHVEGRGKRFFYYFIVAVIFCLVGSLTGVSPVLGIIPMLVVIRFLPKGRIGYVVACSLAFSAIAGAMLYGSVAKNEEELYKARHARSMLRDRTYRPRVRTDDPAWDRIRDFLFRDFPDVATKALLFMDRLNPKVVEEIMKSSERKADGADRESPRQNTKRGESSDAQVSSSTKFDLDKYFVSADIDPTMRFDDPVEAQTESIKILLPIPSGYTYMAEDGQLAAHFRFYKGDSKTLRMNVGIPHKFGSTSHHSDNNAIVNLLREKLSLASDIFGNPDAYINERIAGLLEQKITLNRRIKPTIEQNTQNSIISFFSSYCSRNSKEFTVSGMETFLITNNQCIGISIALYSVDHEDDKRLGITWVKEFMRINKVIPN